MNRADLPVRVPAGQILIYRDGALNLQVRLDGQTVWLPQRLIAALYQRDVRTISEHIRNIYADKELGGSATVRSFRIVQQEGTRQVERTVDHYSLDMILAVGYRARSPRGTQFRQRATARDMWVPAINNHGGFGRWAFLEIRNPRNAQTELRHVL